MINHVILQGSVSCVNKWKIYDFHILSKEHKEKILQSKKMCARLVRVSLRENYYEWSKVSLLLQMHKLRRRNSIQTHRDLLSLVSGCTKDAALDSTSRGVSIIWKKQNLNQICKLNTQVSAQWTTLWKPKIWQEKPTVPTIVLFLCPVEGAVIKSLPLRAYFSHFHEINRNKHGFVLRNEKN